jgi:formate/nitrite transporter FocA (FNT family)
MADAEIEHEEIEEAKDRSAPGGKIVYEAVRQEGIEELERPSSALAWSGLAAGLSMGFSFLGMGILRAFLPEAPWTVLVSSLGMSLGFLIVILGRQQLFTENTLTVILPLMRQRSAHALRNVLRLWTIVLVANVLGGLVIAFVLARTQTFESVVYEALRDVARDAMPDSFGVGLLRGIFAGWLIALVVWLLPFAETSRISVIIALTYLIGLAHFAHVIVGSIEAGFRVFVGDAAWRDFFGLMFLPALLGNILGGVTLVAALNHAQVVAGRGKGAQEQAAAH